MAKAEREPDRHDVCECGDYRKSHENGEGRCYVCASVKALWDDCQQFKFSHREDGEVKSGKS